MKTKLQIALMIIGILALLVCVFFCGRWSKKTPEIKESVDTVVVYDTHRYYMPRERQEAPLLEWQRMSIPHVLFVHTTDTLTRDSVIYEPVRLTQKHYREEEYEAWVSGFYPQLDSINIFSKTNNIYHTITKTEKYIPQHNVYLNAKAMISGKMGFAIEGGYAYRWKCFEVGGGVRYEPLDKRVSGIVKAGVTFGW